MLIPKPLLVNHGQLINKPLVVGLESFADVESELNSIELLARAAQTLFIQKHGQVACKLGLACLQDPVFDHLHIC